VSVEDYYSPSRFVGVMFAQLKAGLVSYPVSTPVFHPLHSRKAGRRKTSSEKTCFTCLHNTCITASGSKSHQLLAAWRKGGNHQTSHKMRARPYYYGCSLKDEGAPPLFEGAPPLFWVLSITNKHSSTSPNPPPSYLPATSADPPSPPIPRSGGDHIPLHPLLTSNPPLRPRGLGTVF
jgi:hypothetical protein